MLICILNINERDNVDDEALTPFVDALSATLIIMVLVAISFILQTTLSLETSARNFVNTPAESAIPIKKTAYNPFNFQRPLRIDTDKKEILYFINFTLSYEDILNIKKSISSEKILNIMIRSNQSQEKATINMLRFIKLINLPKAIEIKTEIIESGSTVNRLTWSN
jgi:hypothetical protein